MAELTHDELIPTRAFLWAGYLIGFSLAGFFDGILLHQILQWHHLLSGIEGARFQDLRVQVMADGVFHLVMYVLALVGLYLLWHARGEARRAGADRLMFANALIGFGVWHVVDAVFVHWMLGFHRIRMDAENLLLWDLIWLVPFGVVPLVAGLLLRQRGGGVRFRPGTVAMLLALALVIAGPWAARPAPDTRSALVLFNPGTPVAQRMAAVAAIDARVVWTDATGDIWALDLPEPRRARALYRDGGLLVSNSLVAVGCFSWSVPPTEASPI
jgi:uncharacterized membrane protein